MRDAIRRGMCFNAIHLKSGLKFNLFVASRHALGREQLERRQEVVTALLGGDPIRFPVISAEDIVLVKLFWYRDGGERGCRGFVEATDRTEFREWRS